MKSATDIERITFLSDAEFMTLTRYLLAVIPEDLGMVLAGLVCWLTSMRRVELPDGSIAYQDLGSVP